MLTVLGLVHPAHALADDVDDTATPNGKVSLTIDAATPVVTKSSGYHITVTVTNKTASTLQAGSLSVLTSVFYTFNSRTDMQHWAQGNEGIPLRNELGQVDVPAVQSQSHVTVTVKVPADNAALSAITTWGPKPLLARYQPKDGESVRISTFLTRSADGLKTAGTPSMNVTVALPLTSASWQADHNGINDLLSRTDATGQGTTSSPVLSTSQEDIARARNLSSVMDEHPLLQVVADPTVLDALPIPMPVTAIMQPSGFDITRYAAMADEDAYADAGVATNLWSASTALQQFKSATGDQSLNAHAYAWQGQGSWTLAALTKARAQGYTTVIADQHFDQSQSATVHTGKHTVSTAAGDVTVLSAQGVLSDLAQGSATADDATAEASSAGRLARFMAQSAFYQMEQPYISRNLLVTLPSDVAPNNAGALMSAIEQASWLHLTSLSEMSLADATDEDTSTTLPTQGLESDVQASTSSALTALAGNRADLKRFNASILAAPTDGKPTSRPSGSGTGSTSSETDSLTSDEWVDGLSTTQAQFALHALSLSGQAEASMLDASRYLAGTLLNRVSITPSENITVVSETASMPVTIRNGNPYPVHVKVSSLTDSMEIVTSRLADVMVPPNGEAQVTFTIRVATSASTTATLTLQDRDGTTFSAAEHTKITSSLQISDKSGLVIIAFAVALGILGLFRQLHRTKDPDE